MNTNNIVRTNVLIVDDIIIDGVIIMALERKMKILLFDYMKC
jgi:hypothetical protein